MGDKPESALHGGRVAGGVEHHVEELVVGELGELRGVVFTEAHAVGHLQAGGAEVQAVLAAVQRRDGGAVQLRKDHGRHADGAGADHQHALARAHPGATHGVCPDGQKLHHGRLVQGNSFRFVDEGLGHAQELGEGAVAVHAEHLDAHAAVGLACAACDALATRQVGHHVGCVAGSKEAVRGRGFDDARELVPHDARVVQVGLVAGEDVQVGTANAHPLDAQQDLVGRTLGQGAVQGTQGAGGFANDGQHGAFL